MCRPPLAVRYLALVSAFVLSVGSSRAQTPARVTLDTRSASSLSSAIDAGPAPSSQPITLTLTLAQSDARSAALTQFLTDLTTSSSASYRKWLTPAQFASAYGAAADQIAAASTWAQSEGLTVASVSPSGSRITLSGFSSQIQTAFAVDLHAYKVGGASYYANVQQPSLPAEIAPLFSAIDGLDDLPVNTALTSGNTPTPFAALARIIDANGTSLLPLTSALCSDAVSASQLAQYTALFQQAAAQGITTLTTHTCTAGGFPSALGEVTAVALPADTAETTAPLIARPGWQSAPGLPSDNFRHAPDLAAPSLSALASTLSSIAVTLPGGRLGNVNPILYELGPTPGLYTQADSVIVGTWEPATGLGLVDLAKLAKAFPRGTGSSYASFSASNYSPTHGQSITFTSTASTGTGGATPTGTVSFVTSGGTTLGTANLVSGTGTYTTNSLAGGSYTILASYSGDSTYAPASSPTGSIFVQPEASQLAATVSTGNVVGSSYTVAVTDTSASGVGQPSGNVTLTVEGVGTNYTQSLATASTTSGATTFTIPAGTVGTQTLSINCAGDASFSCYSPTTKTVTIAKATPKLAFSFTPTPAVSGATVSFTATVSSVGTAATPTGNVVFYDNGTLLNAGTLVSGSTTAQGVIPTTATHAITATYDGDANYNTVTSDGTSSTSPVGTLSAALSSASAAAGSTVTVSGTVVLSTASVPTGSIVASILVSTGATSTYTGTLVASGTNSATFSFPVTVPATAGTYSVSVVCATADSFTCNTVPLALTSSTATGTVTTSTIITSSSYALTYGENFTLTAKVTPSSTVNSTAPTGSITFSLASGAFLATVPVGTGGLASYQPSTPLNSGTYGFIAAYSGDSAYAASVSATSTPVVITPTVATITATDNPTTVGTGASTTVSATVTIAGSSTPPSGTVTVTVPGVTGAIYTGTLITTGTNAASVNIPVLAPPAGTYALQVSCAGNTNFSCTPTTVSLTSTATSTLIPTVTTLTLTPAAPVSGDSVVLTATVTSATTGASALSGTVTFYSGATSIGTGTIASGVATATVTLTSTTALSLTAVYSGDTLYATSTSAAVLVPLALTPSGIVLTASASSGVAGTNVTLTAQVNGTVTGGTSPTGKVNFYVAGTTPRLLGTGALASTGQGLAVATLNTTTIPAGTQSVYAVYAGDTVFSAATSASVTIGVSDYAITFTPAAITLTAGETGTAVLQLTTAGSFTGIVVLSCTPPANSGITCSLSQSSLTGAGTSTLSIVTVAGTKTAENRAPGFKTIGGVSLAALLCLLIPGRNRRRLPAMLLALLAIGLTANLGCSSSVTSSGTVTGGTPLGTVNLTIDTAGTQGSSSVSHDYTYQVTVQ